MHMSDENIGYLMRLAKQNKDRIEAIERDIADTAYKMQELANALGAEGYSAVQVADSNDALYVCGVPIPYGALNTLGDQLLELEKLRVEYSHQRTALLNKGYSI